MIKYFGLFVVISLFSSCRKDINEAIVAVAGDETEMKIIVHDTTVNAEFNGNNWVQEYLHIDLDGDGASDVIFQSFEDSVDSPGNMRYYLRIQIQNDQYSIAQINESGNQYEVTDSITQEYYGTFPRKTTYLSRSCDSLQGSSLIQNPNDALSLKEGDIIYNDLNWESIFSQVYLTRPAYDEAYWNFTVGGDSLIGNYLKTIDMCNPAPQNETFYIAFKKVFGSNIDYGWVELSIQENNSLYISKSAITN